MILDHIAVVCADLDAGCAYVSDILGVPLQPGGQHVQYGTHNRLLGLGDVYLEVIAKNPDAPATGRATWFGLDQFSGPPRLGNWICRTEQLDVEPALTGPAVALSRGDLHWQITVPDDGRLPMSGAFPTLLRWGEGIVPPSGKLPDSGCRLTLWEVSHPRADWLRNKVSLADPRICFVTGPAGFRATFSTPHGVKHLT